MSQRSIYRPDFPSPDLYWGQATLQKKKSIFFFWSSLLKVAQLLRKHHGGGEGGVFLEMLLVLPILSLFTWSVQLVVDCENVYSRMWGTG